MQRKLPEKSHQLFIRISHGSAKPQRVKYTDQIKEEKTKSYEGSGV
jgi:hypothetical protein